MSKLQHMIDLLDEKIKIILINNFTADRIKSKITKLEEKIAQINDDIVAATIEYNSIKET